MAQGSTVAKVPKSSSKMFWFWDTLLYMDWLQLTCQALWPTTSHPGNWGQLELLVVQRVRTDKYGGRAFAHAAPLLYNSLPSEIRLSTLLNVFNNQVRTFLFFVKIFTLADTIHSVIAERSVIPVCCVFCGYRTLCDFSTSCNHNLSPHLSKVVDFCSLTGTDSPMQKAYAKGVCRKI